MQRDYSSSESEQSEEKSRSIFILDPRTKAGHWYGASKLEQYKEHWPMVGVLLWSGFVIAASVVYGAIYFFRH